jgi:hypothetical protein
MARLIDMGASPRRWMTVAAVGLVLWAIPVAAQRSAPAGRKSMAELTADVLRTTREYRATLERAVPAHEAQVRQSSEALHEGRRLHAAGALPEAYVANAERALAAAERDLADTLAALEEADQIIFEASLQQRLARLAPLPRGVYEDAATLVRFAGAAPWSLKDVPALEQRFVEAFGRRLPISSFGQTKVHDRLGLDHRAAIDVAVHPDSEEGRWLMQHLRGAGIPFIGVRGEVPGSSTGAHVHVGNPSPRLIAR